MKAIAFWVTLAWLMSNIAVLCRTRETGLYNGSMMPCYASPVECTATEKRRDHQTSREMSTVQEQGERTSPAVKAPSKQRTRQQRQDNSLVVKVNNTALAAGAMVRLPSRAAFVWPPDEAPHAISAVIHVVFNVLHFLLPTF